MNFGWFNSDTPDIEFSRTVIHEFGHALGLIHEHQSASAAIPWDIPKVYQYYQETQGWSKDEVDNNIFFRYSRDSTQHSSYDRYSIMHYAIPAYLLLDESFSVGWNTSLSDLDKSYISTVYPIPTKKPKRPKNNNDGNHVGDVRGGIH